MVLSMDSSVASCLGDPRKGAMDDRNHGELVGVVLNELRNAIKSARSVSLNCNCTNTLSP